MKRQKTVNHYCPKCKKHTSHTVSLAKSRGKRSALSRGSIQRARLRGLGRGYGNLGKYGSKPAVSKWKMAGAKSSKKQDLRFKCKECGKSSVIGGKRAKKVEIVE
jgi:large subunit ribosomal protein L44e